MDKRIKSNKYFKSIWGDIYSSWMNQRLNKIDLKVDNLIDKKIWNALYIKIRKNITFKILGS